ncbi:MAG TPA: pentapeptide repeat-containing protein [Candidatus Obscuribacterales bacterium]
MTAAPDADPAPRSDSPLGLDHTTIQQTASQNEGQVIGSMTGGMAIGQVTVYLSQMPTEKELPRSTATLGDNPYQGLKAFREADGDRFFGRDRHIQDLWQRFQSLHNTPNTIRLLPIYGPSGSGKSSLARAGLIPALGRQPLPGRDRARVAVLTPGTHPLDALATVLARIVTQDATPLAKADEFRAALVQTASNQQHDGLRRIAGVFPDIDALPLIVLVDQFEELYTLCDDEQVRRAFVDNLLVAACDRAQQVSVIITMRSDFLGATQQHPQLNQLFSSQGFLVPSMTPDDLAVAIAAPAKQAGYELDKATVQLLVHEAQGQEGALPLLQFALTQIWEGLRQGIEPADTLERIGGVGGAVATEAQRIYNSLSEDEQAIARCIFLSLIQLNDDKTATRRRASISELITEKGDEPKVRNIIHQFARPGVWILVTSANQQQIEMVEVAHEALIQHWEELRVWLNQQWELLCQKHKIEQSVQEWERHHRSQEYLLQGRSLRDAKSLAKLTTLTPGTQISHSARQFIRKSLFFKRIKIVKNTALISIFPVLGSLVVTHLLILNLAHSTFFSNETCAQNPRAAFLLRYLLLSGEREKLEEINLCREELTGIKLQRASLWRANFSRAILANADFEGSDLKDANFEGTDLMSANFSNSFLENANFKNTYLFMADLKDSFGLTEEQLVESLLCQTKLPSIIGLNPDRDCEKIRRIILEGDTFN